MFLDNELLLFFHLYQMLKHIFHHLIIKYQLTLIHDLTLIPLLQLNYQLYNFINKFIC